ncbi:hypothetical protein SAMN05421803_10443 [Nocardiopsis flavescens]|uniref:MrfA-like Zn-binding domain-containing protein n=1 Tax=Nocardiopsis flavescens TaxID=758803 RepID=A0A1M6H5I5_9ACTN|nr:DrmB family protein [Nocardiopsis flavescens]SHJ17460.1 hypothetical protein SAMN05421803_10443 [Nocardiopsis flavescens]
MTNRKLRVRQAQTIVPFGVGAILETQGESFVAADTGRWYLAKSEVVESPRLAARLKVSGFRSAPAAKNDFFDNDKAAGVPCVRFPEWLFCGACRRMVRWNNLLEKPGHPPLCPSCPRNPALVPMRFVQICPRGHMDDVNWPWWAHSRPKVAAQPCGGKNEHLSFLVDDTSMGLEALRVHCRRCDSGRDLLNLLDHKSTHCSGKHPWKRGSAENVCEEKALVVPRNAGNLYYPVTCSALDIPAPEDSGGPPLDPAVVDRIREEHHLWQAFLSAEGAKRRTLASMLADDAKVTEEELFILATYETGQELPVGREGFAEASSHAEELSREEWEALNTRVPITEKNLVTRPLSWPEGRTAVQELLRERFEVTVADRLREVRTLLGFSRVTPSLNSLVPVTGGPRASWLPAVEVFGEGIFLSFDEDLLAAWEAEPSIRERVAGISWELGQAFQQERLLGVTGPKLLPRMPMLHTFSHLFIRQLAFESGYGIASLQERIYARPGGRRHQAGVLVYTSAGDTQGTLGGLAAQGAPEPLAETVLRLLESGSWCSNDPLCSEHGARGPAALNRAACHACTLLPETSCETGNTLLDRVLLIGGNGVPGFFQPVIEAALDRAARTARGQA